MTERNPTTFDPFSLHLASGGHGRRDDGMCLMEAVAFFAGEPHSDSPECADPVLAAFGRALNDALNDTERQLLRPLVPKLVGTRSTAAVKMQRAFILIDSSIRVQWPLVIESHGLALDAAKLEGEHAQLGAAFRDHANRLRALAPLTIEVREPDPSAPPPTFEIKQECHLDEYAIFVRCGYGDHGREHAAQALADFRAGKYRGDLYWSTGPVSGDEEWTVYVVPTEGAAARAARAARAALADLADRAARADLAALADRADLAALADRAARADPDALALRGKIIEERIAAFERAIVADQPLSTVVGVTEIDP